MQNLFYLVILDNMDYNKNYQGNLFINNEIMIENIMTKTTGN